MWSQAESSQHLPASFSAIFAAHQSGELSSSPGCGPSKMCDAVFLLPAPLSARTTGSAVHVP